MDRIKKEICTVTMMANIDFIVSFGINHQWIDILTTI